MLFRSNSKIPDIEYSDLLPGAITDTANVPTISTGEFVLSNPASSTRTLVEQEIPPETTEDGTFRISSSQTRS